MARSVEIVIKATDKASSKVRNIGTEINKVKGGSFSKLSASVTALGVAAGAAAAGGIALLVAGMTNAFNQAADLESQMSGVAAVLGKSAEEIAPLNDLVKELAVNPNLKVSAKQAADSVELLARNGLSMDEIMGGAAENTVLLANATGAQFGAAADVATDTMALFNIEAENMSEAVDGITSVVNNSKFGFDDYRLALAQGGGVAATVGVQFDDFNTSIAAIAPLFASGSDAGTSFKVFLQRLVPQTADAVRAMQDLGLASIDLDKLMEVADGLDLSNDQWKAYNDVLREGGDELTALREATGMTVGEFNDLITSTGILDTAFFDAQGNMNDMAEIADALNEATADLSDSQKNQYLSTIFGTDAMRAAAGMAEFTEEEFRALSETMGETSAADNAATRIDNFRGSMEILKSVISGLAIQFGELLLPVMKELIDNVTPMIQAFGSDLVDGIQRFITLIQAGVTPLGAFNEFLVAMGVSLEVRNKIREMAEQALNLKDQIMGLVNQGLLFYQQNIAPFIQNNIQLKDVLIGLGIVLAAVIIPAIVSLAITIGSIVAPVLLVIGTIALLRTAWENDWNGIQTRTTAALDYIVTGLTNSMLLFQMIWQNTGISIKAIWEDFWTGIALVVETYHTTIQGIQDTWAALFTGDWTTFGENLVTVFGQKWLAIAQVIIDAIPTMLENVGNLIKDMAAIFTDFDWASLGRSIIDGVTDGLAGAAQNIYNKVGEIAGNIKDSFKDALSINSPSRVMQELGQFTGQGVEVGLGDSMPGILATAQNMGAAVQSGFAQGSSNVNNSRSTSITNNYNVRTNSFNPSRQPLPSYNGGI